MKDLNQTGEDEVKAVRLLEETVAEGHHQNVKSPAASSTYFQLFTYADKKDWLLMSIAILFSIGNGVSIVFYALPLKQLINAFANSSVKEDIVNATLKSVYGFLFNSLIVFVNCWFMTAAWTITSERQMNRARKMYLDSLLKQEITWHDQQRPAEICSKMQSQISKVQEGLVTNMTSVLNKLSMGISGIVFAFAVGYEMSLVMIGFLPIMMISGCIRGYYTKQKDMYVQTEKIRIDSDVIEVFDNIKTVKMLRGEQHEIERYKKQLWKEFESNWSHGYKGSLAFSFFFFCIIANYALGFWEGAHLVSNRIINKNTGNPYEVGEVIVIFFTLYLSNLNLCGLPDCLASFSVSRYSMKQIIDVINRETQMKDGYLEMPSKIREITFKDVWFGYGVPLFEGLNLTIGKGITIFVGESGCGKTTIISLLMRFYDVLEGSLSFIGEKKGVNIMDIRSESLREKIGYVGQEPVLIGNTFREVLMAENISDSEIYEVLQIVKADEFVRKLGLYSTIKELSGGEKQRLAIARALLKKPKILILDESTSALDNRTEKFVLEGLKKLSIDFIIMIAHRKETLVYADRVIRFGKGKVIDEGSLTELMERGVDEEFIEEKSSDSLKGTCVNVMKKQEIKEESMDEALEEKKRGNFRMRYMRELMKLNKDKWYLYVLGIVGAIYFGTIFPIFSYLISRIIFILQNISLASTETYPFYKDQALNLSNILFFISIGSLLFTTLRYLTFEYLTERIGYLTKLNAFSKFIKSNYISLENNPQQFSYVVTKNCEDLKQVPGNFIPAILENLVTLVVGLGISAYFSWQITLVFLGILPLLLLSSKAMMAFNHGMHSNTQELHLKTTPLLLETLTNLRTVRSCNLSSKISSKYQSYLSQALSYSIKAGNFSGILFGVGQTLISLCLGFIFLFGAYLIEHEIIDVRDMYTAIFGVMFAGVQAGGNLHFLNMVGKGKVGVCVYFEKVGENEGSGFIDSGSGNSSGGGDSTELENTDFSVCFDNLSFGYPGKDLLFKDFNLLIRSGEKIGIVGESGCGKSTLVGLLFGLYEGSKGGVKINDRGRKGLGVVMQEPVLFNRSMIENIRYNCDHVRTQEIEEVCKNTNCYNFITDPSFNPSTYPSKYEFAIKEGLHEGFGKSVGARGCYLSGGQRQRIAIARALVKKPDILVLDEATSALDCENEEIIEKTMESINGTQIIIAHRICTIMKCDRIIVLKEGRVVEEGTFKDLINKGGYFNELTQKNSNFV